MDVTCYELDGVCYYLSHMQDRVLIKLGGAKKQPVLLKKFAYHKGLKGEPIPDVNGGRATAIVMPDGEQQPVTGKSGEPPTEVPSAPSVDISGKGTSSVNIAGRSSLKAMLPAHLRPPRE